MYVITYSYCNKRIYGGIYVYNCYFLQERMKTLCIYTPCACKNITENVIRSSVNRVLLLLLLLYIIITVILYTRPFIYLVLLLWFLEIYPDNGCQLTKQILLIIKSAKKGKIGNIFKNNCAKNGVVDVEKINWHITEQFCIKQDRLIVL